MLGALRPGNRDNLAQFRQTGSGRKSIAHPRTTHTALRYSAHVGVMSAEDNDMRTQAPPYTSFFLNPYIETRCWRCPVCTANTRQRTVPLVIRMTPQRALALKHTCRYCPACDLLIAHQDEVEIALETVLADRTAASAFKDDQIAGTLDRPDFQRALQGQMTMEELIARTRAFTRVLEVKLVGGWGHE